MRTFARYLILLAALTLPLLGQHPVQKKAFLSADRAQPILSALEEVLPQELKGKSAREQAAIWPTWVARRDAEIRARLTQGDEDTLVNFLLFGTSFTHQPRVTAKDFKEVKESMWQEQTTSTLDPSSPIQKIVQGRINDLVRGILHPAENERLLYLHRLVQQKGFLSERSSANARLKEYVVLNLVRVLNEMEGFAKTLEAAKLLGDPGEEFIERSKLFRDRGLSLDTSPLPNFAIEQSLKQMKAERWIAPGVVRRVAIVGPGLDFTDKQAGYDFYPQQTIQPFALIDSLLRLGLARSESLEVTTLDVSPRVNDHLLRARSRARQGVSYVLQLPRSSDAQWKTDSIRYWEQFGNQIGSPTTPVSIPTNLTGLRVRAVRVRPAIVTHITPVDLNIVTQQLDLPPEKRFDLIIGTNVFVYYDTLDQAMALANVEQMLRPGGFLLSNNALLELPSSKIHSVGYQTVVYSDRPDDGDHIVWYQRAREQ